MGDLPHAVLFACGMNSVRSPMAEGIMKFLFGRQVYVDSVGVAALLSLLTTQRFVRRWQTRT